MLPKLLTPTEFQRHHVDWFRTPAALRYHIERRASNGMLEAGAVVETRLGIRIDPEKFPVWLLGQAPERDHAA